MKKVILVFVVLGTIFSCKSDKKDKVKTPIVEEIEEKDAFSLTINAIIEKDDTFILFFLEEGQKNITKKNSIAVKVLASLESQKVSFIIKEGILPIKFFLRFGNEQKAQKISFSQTKISYGKKSFIIKKKNFFQFFIPNKFIEFDNQNNVAISKEVDGDYKPRFGSRNVLIDKIFYNF